jgi:magnesium transporter
MSKTSGYLFCLLAESLYKQSRPTLNEIGKNIEAVEKDIFEEKQDLDVIRMLATYRRNILGFRRIIDPQRYLMANLSHIRTAFINEDTSLYFDNIHDYLTKLWALTDIYNDTINGLHVTVESLVNQRTSIVIRALTVISVSLLPLTLLSGIYGMNVDGMPFAKNSFLVFSLFIILSAIIILIILIMRKKRWI